MPPDDAYAQARFLALEKEQRGAWLRYAIDNSGLDRRDVWRYLDISDQTLADWCNKGIYSWADWIAVCHVLHLPITWELPAGATAPKLPRGRPAVKH